MSDPDLNLPEKRSAEQMNNEGSKRRAPYVVRACDTCRRRKGRCDGNKPCGYCAGRSGECSYTFTGEDRRAQSHTTALVKNESETPRQQRTPLSTTSMTSLNEAVAQMQEQLNALAARVDSNTSSSQSAGSLSHSALISARPSSMRSYSPDHHQNITRISPSTSTSDQDSMISSTNKRSNKRFYGPTSPDYSFNVAWSRARGSNSGSTRETTGMSPAIEDDSSEDEALETLREQNGIDRVQQRRTQIFIVLTHFRNLMNRESAFHHVRLFHEVIGQLHPLVEVDWLMALTERVFEGTEFEYSEIDLIILNLALCISLCAELMSISAIAQTMFGGCQHLINAQLMGVAKDPKQAKIAILVGFYHFFEGRIPLALRMIGVAGRHIMELGLHSKETSQQWTVYTAAEISTLSCNLIILDRQWAASSGLPPNFKFADFELVTKNAVDSDCPYLKAMINFTLMSQDFNDPVTRVARGRAPIDVDELEILKFKVMQWRANVLNTYGFTHPEAWTEQTGHTIAAWKLIVYLRANAVLAILLRPYFLCKSSQTTEAQVEPALRVVYDTVTFLQIVDKLTDNYKKQHPLLQHFLSSICSLLFLVVAYIENRDLSKAAMKSQCLHMVRDGWDRAVRLSAAYKGVSFASRRLWKRLMGMRESLVHLRVIQEDRPSTKSPTTSPTSNDVARNFQPIAAKPSHPQPQVVAELDLAFRAQHPNPAVPQPLPASTNEELDGVHSRFLMNDFTNPSNYRAFEYM